MPKIGADPCSSSCYHLFSAHRTEEYQPLVLIFFASLARERNGPGPSGGLGRSLKTPEAMLAGVGCNQIVNFAADCGLTDH